MYMPWVCILITGELRWAYSYVGGLLLILSIHFTPRLRQVLSFRYAVFYGSISFPVYLIHSFLMRTVLVWVVYGLIPESPWLIRAVLNTIAFVVWMTLLTYLSVLWRDKVDVSTGVFTQWVEDIMVGKKTILGSIAIHNTR